MATARLQQRDPRRFYTVHCIICREPFQGWGSEPLIKERVCPECATDPIIQRRYGVRLTWQPTGQAMEQPGLEGFPQKRRKA